MMCAQHALNAILQGHFFDPTQLAQIANEIAEFERDELGLVEKNHDAVVSHHVDETGHFSVEVMDRALKAWDMNLARWYPCERLRERHQHPEREFAFLLNLSQHWFALRGFGSRHRQWYNLNSFFARPEWLGDAYLGSFLHQAELEQYSIFVIEPFENTDPPATIADDMVDIASASFSRYAGIDGIASEDDEDEALQAAIRSSLEDHSHQVSQQQMPMSKRRNREDCSPDKEDTDESYRHRVWRSPITDSPGSGHRSQRRSLKQRGKQRIMSQSLSQEKESSPKTSSIVSSSFSEHDILESSSCRTSPFLHPTVAASLLDEDVQDIEEDQQYGRNAAPSGFYTLDDDNDAQLQASIALSLGQPCEVPKELLEKTQRALDNRHAPEPIPDDVIRIRNMREQAAAAISKADISSDPDKKRDTPATVNTEERKEEAVRADADFDADSETTQQPISAEEMRRRRLARFG